MLITALRKSRPTLPIIAMSGGGRISARDCLDIAKAFGAAQVLAKPFGPQALCDAVDQVLKKT